jgi:hypothetical protein
VLEESSALGGILERGNRLPITGSVRGAGAEQQCRDSRRDAG